MFPKNLEKFYFVIQRLLPIICIRIIHPNLALLSDPSSLKTNSEHMFIYKTHSFTSVQMWFDSLGGEASSASVYYWMFVVDASLYVWGVNSVWFIIINFFHQYFFLHSCSYENHCLTSVLHKTASSLLAFVKSILKYK